MLSAKLDRGRVFYADELVLPLYLAVISLAVLVAQKGLSSRRNRVIPPTKTSSVARRGSSVYGLRVLRLLLCLGLVGVSVVILIKGLVVPVSGTHGTSRKSSIELSYGLFYVSLVVHTRLRPLG